MEPSSASIRAAADRIRQGGLVVFPTETVYGLGAMALDPRAVAGIFQAKGRPADNPLIVHLSSLEQLSLVAGSISGLHRSLLQRFSPGPFTLVLPAADELPRLVTAGLPTVAVRIPRHPVAQEFLQACGCPVAAPSANRSGGPSPTTAEMARRSLGDAAAFYLDGGPCEIGLESTVVAVYGDTVHILRPGAISDSDILEAVPHARVEFAWGTEGHAGPAPSPGMRHRHYQPACDVLLVRDEPGLRDWLDAEPERPEETAVIAPADVGARILAERPETIMRIYETVADYARLLYAWFHELDESGVKVIVAFYPAGRGIGVALQDRLSRAAGGRFVK